MSAEQNAYIRLMQYLEDSTRGLLVTMHLVEQHRQCQNNSFDRSEFRLIFELVTTFLQDGKRGVKNRLSPVGISTEERIAAQIAMAANGVMLVDIQELGADGADHIEKWLDSVVIDFYHFRQQSVRLPDVSLLEIRLRDLCLEATTELVAVRQMLAQISYPYSKSIPRG